MTLLAAFAEEAEQGQKDVDKIEVKLQGADNGYFFETVASVGIHGNRHQFLRVVRGKAGEHDDGDNRNKPVKSA